MPTISQIGYCKYIIPEEGSSNFSETAYAQDVIKGRGVNFSFNYSWSGNNCTISEVRWKPGKIEYDSVTHERSFVQEGLESNGFQSANNIDENRIVLKIQFGQGESGIVPTNQDGHKSIYVNKTYTPDNSDWSVTINTTNNFLLANFKYQYIGASTGVTYIVEIKDIKIPRTNKYENNVIFNKDGLNELIDHFQKYPVIGAKQSNKYGHIKITHGKDPEMPKDISILGFANSNTSNLLCGTHFLPWKAGAEQGHDLGAEYIEIKSSEDYIPGKTYYYLNNDGQYLPETGVTADTINAKLSDHGGTLYTTHKWRNLYMSGDIGSSAKNGKIGNIYATKGDFSETVTADTLTGNLVGGSIKIGGTTSNPKFQVNSDGDVIMNGSITWGNGNPLKQIYHRGVTDGTNQHAQPELPNQSYASMPSDGTSWHKTYHNTDYWMTFSTDGGNTWQTPTRINAQDGKDGKPGEWKDESIIRALHNINADGLFTFQNPVAGSNETEKLLGIRSTAILTSLLEANKIEMNSGPNYNSQTSTSINGGFISFRIPTPFPNATLSGVAATLNSKGWNARLGYLRGNGDGAANTAGIGFVIYTQATWAEAYASENDKGIAIINNTRKTIGDKIHLIVSSFILTNKGIALMTSENTSALQTWLSSETASGGHQNHYVYKYLAGESTSWSLSKDGLEDSKYTGRRYNRLWLHEDNGGLYYSYGSQGSRLLKPWGWDGVNNNTN